MIDSKVSLSRLLAARRACARSPTSAPESPGEILDVLRRNGSAQVRLEPGQGCVERRGVGIPVVGEQQREQSGVGAGDDVFFVPREERGYQFAHIGHARPGPTRPSALGEPEQRIDRVADRVGMLVVVAELTVHQPRRVRKEAA